MYFLRRLFLTIPTLILISVVAFGLGQLAPVQPQGLAKCESEERFVPFEELQACLREEKEKLNLHLPAFYVSLQPFSYPDSLDRFEQDDIRQALQRLTHESGNWPAVEAYFVSVRRLRQHQNQVRSKLKTSHHYEQAVDKSVNLLRQTDPRIIRLLQDSILAIYQRDSVLRTNQSLVEQVRNRYQQIRAQATPWKTAIPWLNWHGLNNQYHCWISNVFTKLDFGRSWKDGQKVSKRIGENLFWSMVFATISILISYGIGIPLGIWAAKRAGSRLDTNVGALFFGLQSIPSYLVLTILMVLFANADLPGTDIFYATFNINQTGLGPRINSMILPLLAYTLGSFAAISRILRLKMLEVLNQDFIRTARAKGLDTRAIIWKHAFKNALLPLITMLGGLLPALVSGSAIIESIYEIPGMGQEMYLSTLSNDMPMVMGIFLMVGLLTILGYLIADMLYAVVNPRIRLTANSERS